MDSKGSWDPSVHQRLHEARPLPTSWKGLPLSDVSSVNGIAIGEVRTRAESDDSYHFEPLLSVSRSDFVPDWHAFATRDEDAEGVVIEL